MDTDELKLLEEIIKGMEIKKAARFLMQETGFDFNCCFVWATYVNRPSLRMWVRKVAFNMRRSDYHI